MGKDDLLKRRGDNLNTNKEATSKEQQKGKGKKNRRVTAQRTVETSSKEQQKGKGKKNRRVTTQRTAETSDDTVEVMLLSSGEEYSTALNNTLEQVVPFGYDRKLLTNPDHSILDVDKKRAESGRYKRLQHRLGCLEDAKDTHHM